MKKIYLLAGVFGVASIGLALSPAEAKKARFATQVVQGTKVMTTSSGGNQSSQPSIAAECVSPKKPGGKLVLGSGRVTEEAGSGNFKYDGKSLPGRDAAREKPNPVDYYNIGWFVTTNTSESICVQIFARTSAKETNVWYNAKVIATEKYPVKK